MTALIASIPILLVIVLMIAFNKPAKIALPIGWVVALANALPCLIYCVITVLVLGGLILFGADPLGLAAAAAAGG